MPYEEMGYDPINEERPSLLARLVRLNRYIFVLLVIPISWLAWRPPFEQEQERLEAVHQLEMKRDTAREKADRLKQKLELIKTNPDYLEIVARDRLHLQKDGETIVRFENE